MLALSRCPAGLPLLKIDDDHPGREPSSARSLIREGVNDMRKIGSPDSERCCWVPGQQVDMSRAESGSVFFLRFLSTWYREKLAAASHDRRMARELSLLTLATLCISSCEFQLANCEFERVNTSAVNLILADCFRAVSKV